MNKFNPEPEKTLSVLATDLDGTLIPLPGHPENVEALEAIRNARSTKPFRFVYATGRHAESVMDAIRDDQLPLPDWMICDVGTTILHRDGDAFHPYVPYSEHLNERTNGSDRTVIEAFLQDLEGLELQIPAHQREFKISYECETDRTDPLLEEVNHRLAKHQSPFEASGSVDPFRHCGLIDLLPTGVSKAYALHWLAHHADFTPEEVVYAGDSGNDLPALTGEFHAIVVANASEGLAEKVQEALTAKHASKRFYAAKGHATSGVLEGCRHYGLI